MVQSVVQNVVRNVVGRNSGGVSWTPQIPTGLTLTVISDTVIQADWTNVDTEGDGVKVYISTDNVNFTLKSTVALGVATANLESLTAGTLYYAYVVSYKGSKESEMSDIVSKITRDINALAFIAAEEITDSATIEAIDILVKDLKAINVIEADFVDFTTPLNSKRKALYPFIGTNAVYNKFNLINPVNSDGAFRLVYTGSPNISTNGIKFITNTEADSKLNENTILNYDSHEIDFMISEHILCNGLETEMGTYNKLYLGAKGTVAGIALFGTPPTATQWGQYFCTNAFFQLNKKNSNANGVEISRNLYNPLVKATATGSALDSITVKFGHAYLYPQRRWCWAGIGDSISDAANIAYKNAIDKFQYALGRLSVINLIGEGHSQLLNLYNTGSVLAANGLQVYDHVSYAIAGSLISDITSRISTLNAHMKSTTYIPFKNCMILWIGTNNLVGKTTEQEGIDVYYLMKSYIQTQLANGYDNIIALTCMPRAGMNALPRDTFNNLMRTDLVNITKCSIVDTDTAIELTDSTNTTYFSDGIHLTAAGDLIAQTLIATVVDVVY